MIVGPTGEISEAGSRTPERVRAPELNLGSGLVSGLEALVRWTSVELGTAPPIGEWVLRTACIQAKAGHDEGLQAGRVAVNVSSTQLAQRDFGSMVAAVLRELSVDRPKIDRSFIHRMHTDADDRALVSAMIKMAQTIGIGVIAEGVEDFSQLLQLQDGRCDQAQGYLLSRPMPAAEARGFLMRLADTQETGRTVRLRKIAQ